MKKFLSIALALALVLSLGVSAFATISGKDAEGNNITESLVRGNAQWVSASESKDVLTVTGDVTGDLTTSNTSVACMNGATITVEGNVTKDPSKPGNVISASDSNVKVGGNATGNVRDIAIKADGTSDVIVEGLVTGDIKVYNNNSEVYIGQWEGNATSHLGQIHYLLGFADDSLLGDIGLVDTAGIITRAEGEDKIEGVKKNYYFYTTTADKTALSGKEVTLKPNDNNKILTVSGHEKAGVTYTANADGTVTFLIGNNFNGGLQNLVLVLVDKPGPGPDPTPVYYLVPVGSVTTASVKLPAGVAEGLIKALDSADHAGITVDSSLVGDGSVKVLKDGKELSAKDFSIYTHADGSIDVILSNTFLHALGSGSYDFTAVVGGTEIEFSTVVAV